MLNDLHHSLVCNYHYHHHSIWEKHNTEYWGNSFTNSKQMHMALLVLSNNIQHNI
jgi:hypothetical protein